MSTTRQKRGVFNKLCQLVFRPDTIRNCGEYPNKEGVARLVWEYVFWLVATALVAVSLGRLKRWLLRLAGKKKTP